MPIAQGLQNMQFPQPPLSHGIFNFREEYESTETNRQVPGFLTSPLPVKNSGLYLFPPHSDTSRKHPQPEMLAASGVHKLGWLVRWELVQPTGCKAPYDQQ
jgi:hypothetical protein